MSTSEQWNTAIKAVITKATSDADFRAKCLSDPAAALKEVSGLDVPEIKFAEQADGSSIVLPPLGSDPDELTELEQLDSVAGGDPGYTQFKPTQFGCR
jgi:hypothetical protein